MVTDDWSDYRASYKEAVQKQYSRGRKVVQFYSAHFSQNRPTFGRPSVQKDTKISKNQKTAKVSYDNFSSTTDSIT